MNIKELMFTVKNFLLLSFAKIKKAIMELLNRGIGCAFLILGIFVFGVSIIISAFDLVYFHISRNDFNHKSQKNINSHHNNFATRL